MTFANSMKNSISTILMAGIIVSILLIFSPNSVHGATLTDETRG